MTNILNGAPVWCEENYDYCYNDNSNNDNSLPDVTDVEIVTDPVNTTVPIYNQNPLNTVPSENPTVDPKEILNLLDGDTTPVLGNENDQIVIPRPTQGPVKEPVKKEEKDNSLLYLGIGSLALVFLYKLIKKKK